MTKEFECEIWCPQCHTLYAQVFRVERSGGHWEHVKEPASAPSICTLCATVLERH